MPVLTSSSLGRRTLRGAAVATLATIYPAAAQQVALTAKQCSDAVSIANALMRSNTGKISGDLVDSFTKFRVSKCDLNTDWKIANEDDRRVFGEFRLRLIALRIADPK
jgi:hypothetical protein